MRVGGQVPLVLFSPQLPRRLSGPQLTLRRSFSAVYRFHDDFAGAPRRLSAWR